MTRVRDGFALLSMLWVMVAASVVGLSGALAARENVDAARNRADGEKAAWRAHDCLERGRAATDEALRSASADGSQLRAWRELDRLVAASPLMRIEGCVLWVEAAGARLDVNAAGDAQLRSLFSALGIADSSALAERLLDWRDADDVARASGAEVDWYVAQRRFAPRNGPLPDIRELARVPGFEDLAAFDAVLGVEPGRIPVNSAPLTVLASVPGFTPETLARIALDRESGRQVIDLLALASTVSPASSDSMLVHFQDIVRLVTIDPEAWVVRARGHAGSPATFAFVEVRVVLDEDRAAVMRYRNWR